MKEWLVGISSIAIAFSCVGWLHLSLPPTPLEISATPAAHQRACPRKASDALLTIGRLKSSLSVETYTLDGVDGPLPTPTNALGRTAHQAIGFPASFPLVSMLDSDQMPDLVVVTPPLESESRSSEVSVVYSRTPHRQLSFKLRLRPERPNLLLGDWNGSGVAELGLYYPETGIWDFYPDFPTDSVIVSELIPRLTWRAAPAGFALAADVAGNCNDQPVLWLPGAEPRFVVYSSLTDSDATSRAEPTDADGENRFPEPVPAPQRLSAALGLPGDLPVVADLNCDGRADLTVYRPSNATWYYLAEPGQSSLTEIQFGTTDAFPLTADYDGDGCVDLAIYARRSNPPFSIRPSRYSARAYSLFPSGQALISTPQWGNARTFPPETWKYNTFLSRHTQPEPASR